MKLLLLYYTSLFVFCFTSSALAQDTLTNQKYSVALDVGFSPFYSNDNYTLNSYRLNYRDKGGVSYRIDFVYYPFSNWGYSFSYERNTYSYEAPLYSNSRYSDFNVIKNEDLSISSNNFLLGINYKYYLIESIAIIPRIQLGFNFMEDVANSILLKEKGSNNIKEVNTLFSSSNSNLYISFRTDIRLKLATHLGCMMSVFTENYIRDIKCNVYYKENLTEGHSFEKFQYHHSAINVSFGLFYDF